MTYLIILIALTPLAIYTLVTMAFKSMMNGPDPFDLSGGDVMNGVEDDRANRFNRMKEF